MYKSQNLYWETTTVDYLISQEPSKGAADFSVLFVYQKGPLAYGRLTATFRRPRSFLWPQSDVLHMILSPRPSRFSAIIIEKLRAAWGRGYTVCTSSACNVNDRFQFSEMVDKIKDAIALPELGHATCNHLHMHGWVCKLCASVKLIINGWFCYGDLYPVLPA